MKKAMIAANKATVVSSDESDSGTRNIDVSDVSVCNSEIDKNLPKQTIFFVTTLCTLI